MTRRRPRRMTESVSFDRVADTFERTRPIPFEVLRRAYRRLFRDLRVESRITILDVGVGTGRMIRPLMGRRVTLSGVDISLAMLSHLRHRYKAAPGRMTLHMIRADASRLPFRESTAQVVQSTHIIHLLRSWKAALVEWQRIVSNGGSLVLMWESGQRSSVRRAYERAARQPLTYREMRSFQVQRFLLKRDGAPVSGGYLGDKKPPSRPHSERWNSGLTRGSGRFPIETTPAACLLHTDTLRGDRPKASAARSSTERYK